ncbi:MAG: tetratricopeptide repeat protein [Gammaproteobacteria bacterium]|jgi:tetratricopeptide (TPR) repeat protein
MFFKNTLYTLIIVSAFFGGVELVLAALGVQPELLTEDPLVGFAENIPQFTEATRADGTVVMQTANNKRGLFNYQEFPRDKAGGSYRIFCMGGSTTFGRPYTDRVSFCGWLRAYLNAADPARDWEVINAGGVSFASYRVARLMNELKQYQPDLFIVYSGQNEFLEQRSYGTLASLPDWVINLNASLSGTRIYTAMSDVIDALKPDSLAQAKARYELGGEVDEILNHTIGPQSYHRDTALKRQIITHYRLNMRRMVRIAQDAGADIILVKPAINLKDMSPFKSEHREDLGAEALQAWERLYRRATERHEAGDAAGALALYRRALDIDDRFAELHFRIGRALFELERHAGAEQAFRRAVEEDIAPLRILEPMQRVLAELAASEKVPLIDFPAILRDAYLAEYDHAVFGKEYFLDHVHASMEGYRLLGMALFDHLVDERIATPDSSWNAARVAAVGREVINGLDPQEEGHTLAKLGKVLEWAGKTEEAHRAFKQALEILGPNPMLYDKLATGSLLLGNHTGAVRYLREMLDHFPGMPGVHSKLAMVLGMQGHTETAIEHCRTELILSPDNPHVHTALANLLARQGEHTAAIQRYDTALRLKPDHKQARVKLAELLIELGRLDEALGHCREALRINPGQYRAHNALGLIMKQQGDLERARYHFSEALRLKPEFVTAQENLQQLQAEHNLVETPAISRRRQSHREAVTAPDRS